MLKCKGRTKSRKMKGFCLIMHPFNGSFDNGSRFSSLDARILHPLSLTEACGNADLGGLTIILMLARAYQFILYQQSA
jgi:hypothetical protein